MMMMRRMSRADCRVDCDYAWELMPLIPLINGASPVAERAVKPQNGSTLVAGCVVSMQTTPAVLSDERVANTKRWPLAWSTHSPGWLELAKLLPLPSVIVFAPPQQSVASDWL